MQLHRFLSTAQKGSVRIVEVGPRDGLQNEPTTTILPAQVKAKFIRDLAKAGLTTIEAGSFVSPKWIPQMANTGEVMDILKDDLKGIRLPVLVPNMKGLDNALNRGAREVSVFTAASEGFTRRNINMTIEESLRAIEKVIERATQNNVPVRGYVSTIVGCPYDGRVDPRRVLDVTKELLRLGCYEISLGDTIGVATPGDIKKLFETLFGGLSTASAKSLAVHFHDTYGQSLANILVALNAGIRTIDSAAAGLGGCPYAPGASGNVATEDVLYMLNGLGYRTGVDLDAVVDAGNSITQQLGRPNRSRVAQAILARRTKSDK